MQSKPQKEGVGLRTQRVGPGKEMIPVKEKVRSRREGTPWRTLSEGYGCPRAAGVSILSLPGATAPRLRWAPVCLAPAQGLLSVPPCVLQGGRPGRKPSVLPAPKASSAQLFPDSLGQGNPRPASCAFMEKPAPRMHPPAKLRNNTDDSTWFAIKIAEEFWTGHRDSLADIRGQPARDVVPDAAAGWRGDGGEQGALPTTGAAPSGHAWGAQGGGTGSAQKLLK